MSDIIKLVLGIIIAAWLLGFVFSFLFKVGILLMLGLGVLYLFRRVFVDR
ncbi:MAG: hypothetical protein Roseis2KO_18810 [Roseivirga sp.]